MWISYYKNFTLPQIESTSLHKDSQEAQDQLQIDGTIKEGKQKVVGLIGNTFGPSSH